MEKIFTDVDAHELQVLQDTESKLADQLERMRPKVKALVDKRYLKYILDELAKNPQLLVAINRGVEILALHHKKELEKIGFVLHEKDCTWVFWSGIHSLECDGKCDLMHSIYTQSAGLNYKGKKLANVAVNRWLDLDWASTVHKLENDLGCVLHVQKQDVVVLSQVLFESWNT